MNQRLTSVFTFLLAAVFTFASAYSLPAQQENNNQQENTSKSRKQIQEELNNVLITPDFDGQPLSSVINFIQSEKVSFTIAIKSSQHQSVKVTKKLQNPVTIKQFLRLTLSQHGLTAIYQDGAVVIVEEGKGGNLQRRFYDVRDLLFDLKDFKGPKLMLKDPDTSEGYEGGGSGGGGGGGFIGGSFQKSTSSKGGGNPIGSKENFKQLIKKNIGGQDTWGTPRTLRIQNGILIVNQTPDIQREILRLINRLRQFK